MYYVPYLTLSSKMSGSCVIAIKMKSKGHIEKDDVQVDEIIPSRWNVTCQWSWTNIWIVKFRS